MDSLFSTLPTPCYVVDTRLLKRNLELLAAVKTRTGCRILLAQKAFSMFSLYPMIGRYLDGAAASGLFEARLANEHMPGENHVFAPAFRDAEMDELLGICDHIVFNSFEQWERYKDRALRAGKQYGLRVNPECSTQDHAIYDPCAPFSRLGITRVNFRPQSLEGISGLHFHTLCEQNADALSQTLRAVEDKFGAYLKQMRWINFGGGHHITRADYDVERLIAEIIHMRDAYDLQVYLEPGEAVVLNTGFLCAT
ncbi:MAG: carboxynorspermidine decarboxylase, partial [Oscillospiraceae bacterium]|nr:carboxynorspermidine decarboxylase [Oscillospiraceae bacterium]